MMIHRDLITPMGSGGTIDPAVLSVKKDKVCGYPHNRFESTLTMDTNTDTISIEPNVSGGFNSFTMYAENTELVIDSKIELTLPIDTDGLIYVSMNASKQLFYSRDMQGGDMLLHYAFTSVLYYNTTTAQWVLVGDERHSFIRDKAWHIWAHENLGTQYNGGLNLVDFRADEVPTGAGDIDVVKFGIEAGNIADEDIAISIDARTTASDLDLLSIDSAGAWFRSSENSGTACSFKTGQRLSYNSIDASGYGTQVECADNSFVLGHIVAINDAHRNIIAIQGQHNYLTIQEARDGVVDEIQSLVFGSMPTPEARLLGTVIFRTNDLFLNPMKANIAKVSDEEEFFDWRAINFRHSTKQSVNVNDISPEIQGLINNLCIDDYEFTAVAMDAGRAYTTLKSLGPDEGVIRFWQDEILKRYEFSVIDKIYLDMGEEIAPANQVLYIYWDEQQQKNRIAVNATIPPTAHMKLLNCTLQDEASITEHGALVWNVIHSTVDRAISRLYEYAIFGDDRLVAGFEPTFVKDVDGANVQLLSGSAYILRQIAVGDLNTKDGFIVHGAEDCASITNYDWLNDLQDITHLQDGTIIATDKFVFMTTSVSVNSDGVSKIFVELPKKQYDTVEALEDAIEYSRHSIPRILKDNGIVVAVTGLKKIAGGYSNAWTVATSREEFRWAEFSGGIASPNYPNNYPNNQNVTGSVTGPVGATRMILVFRTLNTEQNYDYLYVRGGSVPSTTSYQIRHHGYTTCPHDTPVIYNRVVYYRFTSDGSVGRQGFSVIIYKAYYPVTVGSTEESFKIIDIRFI